MSPNHLSETLHGPAGRPFASTAPVRSADDVRRIEQVPLQQSLTVRSTYEIFCNSARAFGDKTALVFLRSGDPLDPPIRWSYRQLLARIHQSANLLHALGMGPQDTLAVLLPACLEYHQALWGGAAAGIVQPLNPLLSEEKLVSLMRTARARVLLAWGAEDDAGYWSKALRLRDQVPTLTALLRVAPFDEPPGATLAQGVLDFQAECARQPDDRLLSGRDIGPLDIAAYFHTGGTTGAPKLARHSHGAQVYSAWASVSMTGVKASDVTINGYPLFHVAGVLAASLSSLSAGVEMVIPTTTLLRNKEVLRNYWRLVQQYRATMLSAVPTVLAALANVPLAGADIGSLRYCRTGAAPLPQELQTRFRNLFGLHVHESLGMTEMAGISTITPLGVVGPAGCVGFRLPHSQWRIVALDEQGGASDRDLGAGQTGMVLFKAPNLFSGFLDERDNVGAFTPDGWLASGDLGWIDEQERLNLTGRSKDLIIRSGHNIDPKVIEDALGAHPAVQLCAAVGAPDAYAGELPVVFATLLPGVAASEAELLAFTSQRVDEAPARPKWVHIIERMPVTNVGKIYKPELRQLAARVVVQALVDQACDALGLPQQLLPPAQDAAAAGITLRLAAELQPAQAVALEQRLRAALAPLPVKTTVLRG